MSTELNSIDYSIWSCHSKVSSAQIWIKKIYVCELAPRWNEQAGSFLQFGHLLCLLVYVANAREVKTLGRVEAMWTYQPRPGLWRRHEVKNAKPCEIMIHIKTLCDTIYTNWKNILFGLAFRALNASRSGVEASSPMQCHAHSWTVVHSSKSPLSLVLLCNIHLWWCF